MKNKSFLFISCEEAQIICDKSQYKEATLWEKFKLSLRFLWCRITRTYVSKNKKLTQSLKQSKVTCLKQSEKENLKETLQKELKKQEH
ncbi:hypothetical protein [Bizionia arctica]|uniref:Glycine dehydrogenase n=1 Tax=Bizionia arctica TaxID=1495645 RepID=A0A917GE39_9FLAO|nr:hypothetical protein [Bizionia arctica]GGG41792.1 hypothetical protein GCM10010976_11690 [Bizionia arctica]